MFNEPCKMLNRHMLPQLEAYSPKSGIKMSVTTNQEAIQSEFRSWSIEGAFPVLSRIYPLLVYTCGGQNGSIPVKRSQGSGFYEKNSCMVVEMEGVIDGEQKVVFPPILKGADACGTRQPSTTRNGMSRTLSKTHVAC